MKADCLTIRTSARLHFGLLGWGPGLVRQFGGLGLMIQEPAIDLTAERSHQTLIEGPLAERAERIFRHVQDRLADHNIHLPSIRIEIHRAPPEHVGLGVGTQLSLAIAAAAFRMAGEPVPASSQLARVTGRGVRSGIGLHGFERGGLIVDGGRKGENDLPPLIARLEFPPEWSIVVLRPPTARGLHGPAEIRAFRQLPAVPPSLTEKLCRIVLLGILPAVAATDIRIFGSELEKLQREVGRAFAPAQGGIYKAPLAHEILAECHRAGLVGCGQSSWGPAIYAFSDKAPEEVQALARSLGERLGLAQESITVTRASNHGANIEER